MAKQASHGITWTRNTLQRSSLRPGDSLELSRQHSKVGSKVEIKIWFATQDVASWDPANIAESGAPAAVITLGNLEEPGNRYSGGDSTVKTEAGTKPLSSADDRPGLLAFQLSVFNEAKTLLPKEVWVPCPVTAHDKRTGVVVKVFVDGKEEKLTRKLELLTRQMTWRQKMEALLSWQDKLVYGPPMAVRYDRGQLYSKQYWNGNPRIHYASASGVKGSCYVCSPFGNAFMAYWCNYHDSRSKPVSVAGQTRELLVAAYAELFEGKGPFPRGPLPAVEKLSIAELNATAIDARPGKYFRSTDAGELTQGLPLPPEDPKAKKKKKKADPPKPLKVAAEQLLTWDAKKAKWATQKQLPSQDDWTFQELYDRLVDDEPGNIYLCGSTGHVWLMVVMGGAFTVPKGPVLGGGGDCEPGVYRIHASPAVPLEFGFTTYLKPEYVATCEKSPLGSRTKLISSLAQSLAEIAEDKSGPSAESAIPLPTIYANLKAALDKVLADKELDGLQAYGGTDLTMCNAKLSKGENGGVVFNRGEAAPAAFRSGRAHDDTFKVWKLKRVIDEQTGWLKASHPDVAGNDFLKTLVTHDCRPIDSE